MTFGIVLVVSLLFGCAARAPKPAPAPPATPAPAPAPKATKPALRLNLDEENLAATLHTHVEKLSVEFGPRSADEHWELAASADYVAEQFEASGFTVERQGFDVGDVVAQNVGAEVPGSDLGAESIVVGAHYDTVTGNGGADSNATGVAALLVLADTFRERTPRRRLRFVAYALSEAPHFASESMGSLRHAKLLAARGEKVTLMLSLDSLGNYRDEPGTQQGLAGIDQPLPTVGNFVLVLGAPASRAFAQRLGGYLGDGSDLEIAVRTLNEPAHPGVSSDDWAFRSVGIPALAITDTKALRTRPGSDSIQGVDFRRLARLVATLKFALASLADADAPAAKN